MLFLCILFAVYVADYICALIISVHAFAGYIDGYFWYTHTVISVHALALFICLLATSVCTHVISNLMPALDVCLSAN